MITHFNSFLTHRYDPIRYYHSQPESTCERWQWRGAPLFPKLEHYGNLTIKSFSVISGRSLEAGFYSSAEKQSTYSIAQADLATRTFVVVRLTLPQRNSRCILQPQPTEPPGQRLGGSYPYAEKQSLNSTTQAYWATGTPVWEILRLCREAVSVFYSHPWANRKGYERVYDGWIVLYWMDSLCFDINGVRWKVFYVSVSFQSF